MVEQAAFFPKLKRDILLIIEVLVNVDSVKVQQFLFQINKHSRKFFTQNYSMIERGYENEGLISHKIDTSTYFGYLEFEKLYFQTL